MKDDNAITRQLKDILEHTAEKQNFTEFELTALYEEVTSLLVDKGEEISPRVNITWGWRYTLSVLNENIDAGMLFAKAIKAVHHDLFELKKEKKELPDNRSRPLRMNCSSEQFESFTEYRTTVRAFIFELGIREYEKEQHEHKN